MLNDKHRLDSQDKLASQNESKKTSMKKQISVYYKSLQRFLESSNAEDLDAITIFEDSECLT